MTRILLIFFLMLSVSVSAQLADNSLAPDFTLTDLDGNEHNLQSYLDEGKTVYLDLFATWCDPCWSFHQSHLYADLYNEYGPDGTNEVMVFGIEVDGATNLECMYGLDGCVDPNHGNYSSGDWVTGVPYPMIDDAAMGSLYQVAFFPSFYMVCPNGAIQFLDQTLGEMPGTVEGLLALASDNCLAAEGANNVAVLEYTADAFGCESVTPSYRLANAGTEALTSLTYILKLNGEVVDANAWTGNVVSLGGFTLDFDEIMIDGDATLELLISDPNGSMDADDTNNSLSTDVGRIASGPTASLFIHTDKWPEEISWSITDENGSVVYQNETMDCETDYNYDFGFATAGCYTFTISDAFGDGMLNGAINAASHSCTNGDTGTTAGAVSFDAGDGTIIFNSADYGTGFSFEFFTGTDTPPVFDCAELSANIGDSCDDGDDTTINDIITADCDCEGEAGSSIEDLNSVISLAPNPAVNDIFVQMNTNGNYSIYGMNGAVIASDVLVKGQNQIDVTAYPNGIYFMQIETNEGIGLEKIMISK